MTDEKMTTMRAGRGVGHPAYFHYDPYYHRFIDHVRSLVAKGNAAIIRLHPGTDYPMSEDTLHYRVDREGHVVAIIGYDDEKREAIIADPWNNVLGGGKGGVRRMAYAELASVFVDSTLDAVTIPVPWQATVTIPDEVDGEFTITAKIHYACPVPLAKSYYHLHNTMATIEVPSGLELRSPASQNLGEDGFFNPGDTVELSWRVEATAPINGDVVIHARGALSSSDPYPYEDVIGQSHSIPMVLTPTRTTVK